MLHDWAIEVSPNGWTTNELALAWLRHFDAHTKERTVGAYRLLIMDGHGSHNTKEFYEYCEEHSAVVLCMPPHLSHLLQPLGVGCFAHLKQAYCTKIDSWSRYSNTQVKKENFLAAFRTTFDKLITKVNILAGSECAGLYLHDSASAIEARCSASHADTVIT